MRDQRIIEMLEGRKVPQLSDLPLLKKTVEKKLKYYGPTEALAIQSYVSSLMEDQKILKFYEDFADDFDIAKGLEEIVEAFAAIEKHDLKIATMICTVCGNVFSVDDKSTSLCSHLKEMCEGVL